MAATSSINPSSLPNEPIGPGPATLGGRSAAGRSTVSGPLAGGSPAAAANILQASTVSVLLRPVSNVSVQRLPIQFPAEALKQIAYSLPLGAAVRTAQGQKFGVPVQFTLAGPATAVHLSCSGLPPGVTPVTNTVECGANQTRRIVLDFNVARETPVATARPFTIRYTAYQGAVQGEIPLTLTVWTGFAMQHQLESEWCWAATSTSVCHFYNPSSTITQCQVVNHQLNRTDACFNGDSPDCNQPGYLDEALAFLGCLERVDDSPEPFATVVAQTSAGRPAPGMNRTSAWLWKTRSTGPQWFLIRPCSPRTRAAAAGRRAI